VIRKHCILSLLYLLLSSFALGVDEEREVAQLPFNPSFENIAIEQGLSNYNVSSICQDSLGYIWIGTARGLNRFDGSTFKHFFFTPDGETPGIPYDNIESTFYCNNYIFVNTRLGAASYNLKTGEWHALSKGVPVADMMAIGNRAFFIKEDAIFEYSFFENRLKKSDFSFQTSASFFIRSDDLCLWAISGNKQTIYKHDFHSKELTESILKDITPIEGPFHKMIDQRLFLSSESGLRMMEVSPEGEVHCENSSLIGEFSESSLLSFFISIERWDKNKILICSLEKGLYVYDLKLGSLRKIEKEQAGLSSDLLKILFRDRDGNLWSGTFDKGLEVFYKKPNPFNSDKTLNRLTRDEFINAIAWNEFQNDLVMGTRTQGVLGRLENSNALLNERIRALNINNVINLYTDSEQKLWVAGYDKLVIFDQKKEQIITPEAYMNLKHIQHISEYEGQIYLVAHNGFYVYSLDGKLLNYNLERIEGGNQILHTNQRSIFCSELRGLYAYNRETGATEHLILQREGKRFFWQGAVCLKQESDSVLWVGTLSWGLLRVNLNTLDCINYTVQDGLPGNDVTAIELDELGRLWLSTSDGISCMYAPGQFNNFSSHEGIGNYQFHRRSSLTDKDGTIYFGGNNGLSYFNPVELKLNNTFTKETYFQELIVNDSRVEVGDESEILGQTLPYSDELVFSHRVTNFSIDYSALDFYAHDQIYYTHMLEGWDTRFQLPNRSQNVNYSNLPPGDYTLLIKARRSSGEWSEPASLNITINPAPWKTWWAYAFYFLVFVSTVFLIFSMRFRNQLIASNLELEHKERAREREINEMKLKFFTNISHEFRTPLSVINGVTTLISKNVEFEGYARELFQSLNLNVDRLIRLINQLLTFRELESDTLRLATREERIDQIIEQTCKALSNYAHVKKITLINGYNASVPELQCDTDKVEKILSNLISNAIKYTPEGGRISVMGKIQSKEESLSLYRKLKKRPFPLSESGYLEITVRDNGKGIRKKNLDGVFKRYSKGGNDTKDADYSSSGIGLNFVKRLTIVHKGDIRVESTHNQGSAFSFILPLDKEIYSEEQSLLPSVSDRSIPPKEAVLQIDVEQKDTEQIQQKPKYKIAVVEDDVELCKVLTDTLSSLYEVSYAYDGKSGLEKIKKEKPDLVISDIMMPEMNGIELCEEIKQDELLSHVIVILLSARSEISDQIAGLSKGADLYIPKPFNLDYLLTVISSQIQIRDKIHNSYLKGNTPELKETDANQEVIQFLSRFNSLLEKEISNIDLSVDFLAEQMHMGRSSFYKKFTAITNTSPNVYIAKYRINKAVELLHEFRYTVSEVSDQTGFRNASYFSTMFKKEKGLTPREYIKKIK